MMIGGNSSWNGSGGGGVQILGESFRVPPPLQAGERDEKFIPRVPVFWGRFGKSDPAGCGASTVTDSNPRFLTMGGGGFALGPGIVKWGRFK